MSTLPTIPSPRIADSREVIRRLSSTNNNDVGDDNLNDGRRSGSQDLTPPQLNSTTLMQQQPQPQHQHHERRSSDSSFGNTNNNNSLLLTPRIGGGTNHRKSLSDKTNRMMHDDKSINSDCFSPRNPLLLFNNNNYNNNNNNNNTDHMMNDVDVEKKQQRQKLKRILSQQLDTIEPYVPGLHKARASIEKIPPRYKYVVLLIWLFWKLGSTFLVLYLMYHGTRSVTNSNINSSSSSSNGSAMNQRVSSLAAAGSRNLELDSSSYKPLRVLYVVTSLAEYNTGRRATVAGSDRLAGIFLPVLTDSIETMVLSNQIEVDVYLILAYQLTPDREQFIRDTLPDGVGLQIWNDACPLGYDKRSKFKAEKIIDNTRALSRQHRYVIKDKLPYYDVFLAMEDDMRVTASQIMHFVEMSNQLEAQRLYHQRHADDNDNDNNIKYPAYTEDPKREPFFGPLKDVQWKRIIPGFIRVEVLLNEKANGAQKKLDPIPLDYPTDIHGREVHFDPHPCCHLHKHISLSAKPNASSKDNEEEAEPEKEDVPLRPKKEDVIIWETSIKALSVRQLPSLVQPNIGNDNLLDWVGLLPGPAKKRLPESDRVTGYWSGRDGAFGEVTDANKPSGGQPDLLAQQGGWIATREQIMRFHDGKVCQGSFLPPFDEPIYRKDGQESMNVEFWSGGFQLFTGVLGGCNMRRIISLHPDHFSQHFLYHVANNKQKQLASSRMLRADHLWGQINTVRKAAISAKAKITGIEEK